jgi:hypothetical protein
MAGSLLERYGLGGTTLSEIQSGELSETGVGGQVYGYRAGLLRVGIIVNDGIATRIRPRLGAVLTDSMKFITELLSDECVNLADERIYSKWNPRQTQAYRNGWIEGDENNLMDVEQNADGVDIVFGNLTRQAGFLEVGAPRGRPAHHILRDAIRTVSQEVAGVFQKTLSRL